VSLVGPAIGYECAMADDDRPQTLLGVSLSDPLRAQELLLALTRQASAGHLRLKDAVFVVNDEGGRVHVRETIDPAPGRAAVSGALWAGLFGLILGGPVGWAAGLAVGAGAGAVTAKAVDLGIPDAWVAWFKEAVQPGATILAVLVEEVDTEAVAAELGRFAGAHLVYANVGPAVEARWRQALGDPSASPTGSDERAAVSSDDGGALPPPSPPA
jgi:uncharacterized membrane protein